MDRPIPGLLSQIPDALSRTASLSDLASAAAGACRELLAAALGLCAVQDDSGTWVVGTAGPSGLAALEHSDGWNTGALDALSSRCSAAVLPATLGDLGVAPESLSSALAAAGAATFLVAALPRGGARSGLLLVGIPAAEVDAAHRFHLLSLAGMVAVAAGRYQESRSAAPSDPLDDLPDPCETYDAGWRLRRCNAAHQSIFGLPPDAIGWTLQEVARSCAPRLSQGEAFLQAIEARLDNPSGIPTLEIETPPPYRAFQRVVTPLREGGGYLVFYRDITGPRTAERVKDEFLSIASHELKTPLTSVKGYSQMLQRSLRAALDRADAIREAFNVDLRRALQDATAVREEADRLARLVDQLLDISRIETGRLSLTLRPVDLTVLVPETLASLRMALEDRTIIYTPPSRPTPLVVRGDADRLKQVISNVVENAASYSPKGQPIAVELRETRSGNPRRRQARIAVWDQGIGIAPEDLQHIFERFFRSSHLRAVYHNGLGLGLYISSEIIRQHQGRIWAESDGPDTGSRFCVELPLQRLSTLQGA